MRILYAIQGTGNGHLSRARDIIPILQKKGQLDLLISGTEADVALPYEVKYRMKGLSFVFGKKGGVDILATYKKGNLKRLYKEIKSVPVDDYDIIINDFEPVTAWACRLKGKVCIGLSHQAAVLNSHVPKPKKHDPLGLALLKNYAPVTDAYSFHFKAYDHDIYTPVIRSQIRLAKPTNEDHYTVYLPAYSDKRIINLLNEVSNIKWFVFSKNAGTPYKEKNVYIFPVDNEAFIQSMVSCTGMLCGAGFETPAEAMFLRKKLMVIPMKGQYEQQCNAAALEDMGVPVIKNLKSKYLDKIKAWTMFSEPIRVQYPDITEAIIDDLFKNHADNSSVKNALHLPASGSSFKKFRLLNLGKMLHQITGK